jgi:hypothetical protein
MKNFCCSLFEFDATTSRETCPNIRIIKIKENQVLLNNKSNLLRFFFTVGYTEGEKGVVSRFINFCPYCGVKLAEFYSSDIYVNEENHSFLMVYSDDEKANK